MKEYATAEVARLVGVSKMTLLRWLWTGKIKEPKRQTIGGQDVRLWNDRDLERARKYREANYCKGRGRKLQPRS